MRASSTHPTRRTRRVASAFVIASLFALSVLGAGAATAATPSWPTGHGQDSQASPQPDSGASSTAVSSGKTIGFFEWLRNPGSSNISQLFMNVSPPAAGTTAPGTLLGVKWSIKTDSGTLVRSGTCTVGSTPLCSFGSLSAGQTVYVITAYQTPAGLADGTTLTQKLDFNSTGIPPGGNKSHGDDVFSVDSVKISNSADAAGDFNFSDAGGVTVANAPVGGTNAQQTMLSLSAPFVGAFVNDSPGLAAAKCTNALIADILVQNPWFSCKKLTSLTSLIEVGNGASFKNGNSPAIKVTVSFLNAPSQLNGGHPFGYHYFKDATGEHAELVTELCTIVNNVPTNTTPCLTLGTNSITVWLFHNGNMKY
jgi:hypothetical protein